MTGTNFCSAIVEDLAERSISFLAPTLLPPFIPLENVFQVVFLRSSSPTSYPPPMECVWVWGVVEEGRLHGFLYNL